MDTSTSHTTTPRPVPPGHHHGLHRLVGVLLAAPLLLGLTACSGAVAGAAGALTAGGPSATFRQDGVEYSVRTAEGQLDARKLAETAPEGRRFFTVIGRVTNSSDEEAPFAAPWLLAAVRLADADEVVPAGTTEGLLRLPVPGSCVVDGVRGLLSGEGNNGLEGYVTAGVPEGYCLFHLAPDAVIGEQGPLGPRDGAVLTFASLASFTGDALPDVTWFVAPSNLFGQPAGTWTELTR